MNDRAQVLEMLATGKITPEQGIELLSALPSPASEDRPQDTAVPRPEGHKPRWLHVRVTDAASGRHKVNLTIPMGLVKLGLQIGARFAPEVAEMNPDEIVNSLHQASAGPLVDVQDEEDGERVEIYLD